jgi:hypothetical protein
MARSRGATLSALDARAEVSTGSAFTPDEHQQTGQLEDEFVEFLHFAQDVRRDLQSDTADWSKLFAMAYGLGTEANSVLGILRGIRSLGAQLERSGRTWKISPNIGPSGWEDEESWQRDRVRWLIPHAREITSLLAEL